MYNRLWKEGYKMIDAIVYNSKSGHTLVYAKELSAQLNIPMLTLKEARKHLKKESHIIYMSWIKENKIVKYDRVLKYTLECVVAVGILPATEERMSALIYENQLTAKLFYLPGGISKRRLGILDRIRLKSIESELSFKLLDNGLKREDALALDAILHDLDFHEEKSLEPILQKFLVKEDFIS